MCFKRNAQVNQRKTLTILPANLVKTVVVQPTAHAAHSVRAAVPTAAHGAVATFFLVFKVFIDSRCFSITTGCRSEYVCTAQ